MAHIIKRRVFARALFVINKEGIITSYISPIGINQGSPEILKTLKSLDSIDNNSNNTQSVQEQ